MGDIRYSIWLTEKENTKRRTRIGAAFEGQFGQLNLEIGPGVVIDRHVVASCYISLKPWEPDKAARYKPSQDGVDKDGDDDIPF